MPTSIIDAILPSAGRTPGGDSSSHASDASAPFGPVLSQAIASDSSTSSSSRLAEPAARRTATSAAPVAEDRHESRSGDEHAEVEAGVEAAQEQQQTDADADDDQDEVAISNDASADDAIAAAEAAAGAAVAAAQGKVAVDDSAAATEITVKAAATVAANGTGKEQPSEPALPGAASSDEASVAPSAGKQEIGDVLATEPHLVPGSHTRAKAAKGKPTSGEKAPASETAPHKPAVKEASNGASDNRAKVRVATTDDEKADDDSASTDAESSSARGESKPVNDGVGDPSDDVRSGDKRPAVRATDASTPSTAVAASVQPTDGASAKSDPTPQANSASPAPVIAAGAAAEPAPQSHRGETMLARLTADRSIHATAANGGDEGHGVDRARFVSRVEGAIRSAQQRDGRVHVRLSPPELGALRIELTLHQGALSARVEAETNTARNLLLDNLPALRDRLAQHDVHVERFDVDVRQEGGNGGSPQQGADDRTAREADGRRQAQRRDVRPQLATKPAARLPRVGGVTDSGLDVHV